MRRKMTSDAIRRYFADVEIRILRLMKKHLLVGIDTPHYQVIQQAEKVRFQQEVSAILISASEGLPEELRVAIEAEYLASIGAAQTRYGVQVSGDITPVVTRAVATSKQGFASSLMTSVLRYDEIVSAAFRGLQEHPSIPLKSHVQVSVYRATDKAFLAVRTARGNAPLGSYIDTTLRLAQRDAFNQGTLDAAHEADDDLVQISKNNTGCSVCLPWDGRIVSRTGRTPGYPTLAEATNAGVFHPNCYHRLYPVDTDTKLPQVSEEDQQLDYELKRYMREAEKNVQKWRRKEAVSFFEQGGRRAQMKRREWEQYLQRLEQRGVAIANMSRDNLFSALKETGIVTDADKGAFLALSESDFRTLVSSLSDVQSHWKFEARVSRLAVVDPSNNVGRYYGIGTDNACAGWDDERKQYSLVVGPKVSYTFTAGYLDDAASVASGTVSGQTLEQIRRAQESIRSGRYVNHELFAIHTYRNPMEGVVHHELGHVLHHANESLIDEVGIRSGGHFEVVEGKRRLVGWDANRFGVSARARDSWHEAVAENFALYSNGHMDEVDPDLRAVFRELTDYED